MDRGGRATVNTQVSWEDVSRLFTPLHLACHMGRRGESQQQLRIIELLLGAGADLTITDALGWTAEDILRERHPDCEAALDLFAGVPGSRQAAMLVHARLLVMASHGVISIPPPTKTRSRREAVVAHVELTPMPRRGRSACIVGKRGWKESEEARKLRNLVASLIGLDVGVEGRAMPRLPRYVFVLVMNMLMPRWDPLRKGVKGLE